MIAGLAVLVCAQIAHGGQVQPGQPASGAQTAPAQSPPGLQKQEAQQAAGLETPWAVQDILAKLSKDDDQLGPVLNQLKPQQWYDQKGAPSTYILQLQMAQRQLNDLVISSKMLSQKTESMPLALDLYFRLEALDVTTRSLAEGAKKYADRTVAQRLSELLAHNFDNRERFRDYLKDLATSIDQNYKIADEEAQRCRGMISREAPAKKSRK